MEKQIDVADIFALVAHFGFPVCLFMVQISDTARTWRYRCRSAVLELQQLFQISVLPVLPGSLGGSAKAIERCRPKQGRGQGMGWLWLCMQDTTSLDGVHT